MNSKKLKYMKHDEERYSEFILEQTRQLVRMGFDLEGAEREAPEIAAMYKHHFRIRK